MGAPRRIVKVVHVMLGVEHDGNHFVAAEAKEHAEVVAVARLDLRAFDVGGVISGLMIVVLKDAEHVGQLRAGNENHANPVMNHAAGAVDRLAVIERGELMDLHLPALQGGVGFRTLGLG